MAITGKEIQVTGKIASHISCFSVSVHFSHACFEGWRSNLFSSAVFQMRTGAMADDRRRRVRYGEAFWRAHHEAWQRSDLNQREYCAAQGIPLKAFGNWRARFKAEPEVPARKLLYRRGGLSHTLSHSLSHTLSHSLSPMTYPTTERGPLIVPPGREGHKRRFGSEDRQRIVAEAEQPGASLSEVARRYDIDRRILCRWKRELAQQAPRFVTIEIVDEIGEAVS
jgi:transposase